MQNVHNLKMIDLFLDFVTSVIVCAVSSKSYIFKNKFIISLVFMFSHSIDQAQYLHNVGRTF